MGEWRRRKQSPGRRAPPLARWVTDGFDVSAGDAHKGTKVGQAARSETDHTALHARSHERGKSSVLVLCRSSGPS